MRLSEHFDCGSLIEASPEDAARALVRRMRRFGPVQESALRDWTEVKGFLQPIQSFSTRYVLAALDGWTALASNMRLDNGHAQVLGLSALLSTRAISTIFGETARHWHSIERGELVRSVVCYEDGDRWVFHQEGEPDACENLESYARRRIRDRLTPDLVKRYIREHCQVSLPEAWLGVRGGFGVERSTKDFVVPVRSFETVDDL